MEDTVYNDDNIQLLRTVYYDVVVQTVRSKDKYFIAEHERFIENS